MTDLAINCSLALAEVPPHDRPARARELGYEVVEFWWPFADDAPSEAEREAFIRSVRAASVETVLLNFPGGGASVDDRGLLCVPGREADFLEGARRAIAIGAELGVTRYNPMVGNTFAPFTPDSPEFATAVRNLVAVEPLLAEAGAQIVIEPLSGFEHAAVKTWAQARELVLAAHAAGAHSVGVLFDLYHLAANEDPVLHELNLTSGDVDLIGHVQIADLPGRGWPGTGELPLAAWLRTLTEAGYAGRVGLECTGQPVAAGEMRNTLRG